MRVKFHYTLLAFLAIALLTGLLKKVIIIYFLVILHEAGHLLFLKLFKRKISKMTILPFGGIIDYNNQQNVPLYQDFLINAGGLLVNVFILIFIRNKEIQSYNLTILVFNALPIFPLDGGRIFETILCRFWKYRYAMITTFMVSVLSITIIIITNMLSIKAWAIYLIFIFLLLENYSFFKERKKRYQHFLLEKFLHPNKALKKKRIKTLPNLINNFFKGVNNTIASEKKEISEKKILDKYFSTKN